MTYRQLLEHAELQKQTYAEVWALRVLASPSNVQLASLFLMSKMLRSRFWEFLNLLGSACVFHGIYSVFVLCDHLWFGSFFPSNLQLQLLSQFWGLSLCNFTGRDS